MMSHGNKNVFSPRMLYTARIKDQIHVFGELQNLVQELITKSKYIILRHVNPHYSNSQYNSDEQVL